MVTSLVLDIQAEALAVAFQFGADNRFDSCLGCSLGKFPPAAAVEKRADELLAGFFSELPALRKMLWTDIDAA